MKWMIIPIIFLMSCTRLEYPIVTRYKQKPTKVVKIKEVKETKPTRRNKVIQSTLTIELPIFIVGSLIAYELMIKE